MRPSRPTATRPICVKSEPPQALPPRLSSVPLQSLEVLLPGEDSQAAPANNTRIVPFLGQIAASSRILVEEAVEETFSLPESIVGQGELFTCSRSRVIP